MNKLASKSMYYFSWCKNTQMEEAEQIIASGNSSSESAYELGFPLVLNQFLGALVLG